MNLEYTSRNPVMGHKANCIINMFFIKPVLVHVTILYSLIKKSYHKSAFKSLQIIKRKINRQLFYSNISVEDVSTNNKPLKVTLFPLPLTICKTLHIDKTVYHLCYYHKSIFQNCISLLEYDSHVYYT